MKSPELLESTASEPLTIEEEREMQSALAGNYHASCPLDLSDLADVTVKWQEDDDSQ